MDKNIGIQEHLMNNLNTQRKYGRFCDIRLRVGGQFTWTHSAVMCSISSLINKQCCNALKFPKLKNTKTFSFSSPLTIALSDSSYHFDCFSCLQYLIDIIYGQKIEHNLIHSEHFNELYKLLNISDVLISIINKQLLLDNSDRIECNPSDKTKIDVSSQNKCLPNDAIGNIKTLKNIPMLKRKLKLHGNKIASGKMQSCIECEYKCYKPHDLLAHLRNTGHGVDVCSLCFIHVQSFEELNNHYNLHDHPKPFFCTFCDVRFQTRTLLNLHLPRHSKETPYTCPHCNKGFKWKNGLNSHMIIHSNEKKHLCDECGFSTPHAKTLRAHKLTHTGELFRCTHPGCTHTSSRKENMKIHVDTHNNERPFVCEICGLKFTQSKSLKRHALKHNSIVFFNTCPHCPFKALRSDNLKSHILRHHTEKPLLLELSENFSEPLINTECELVQMEQNLDGTSKIDGDLSVLADAASSRTKILHPHVLDETQDIMDSSVPRNFDNLIANPIQDNSENETLNIENVNLLYLCPNVLFKID